MFVEGHLFIVHPQNRKFYSPCAAHRTVSTWQLFVSFKRKKLYRQMLTTSHSLERILVTFYIV